MDNVFGLTVIFVILSTIVGAFLRRAKLDKCLKEFNEHNIKIVYKNGSTVSGIGNILSTGMEMKYIEPIDEKTTCLIYKIEYDNIDAVIMDHSSLTQEQLEERKAVLEKTWHPGFFKRFSRKLLNIYKTVKDSFVEIINLAIAQVKTTSSVVSSQSKYVNEIKDEVIGTFPAAFEPLLERYIGNKVVTECTISGKKTMIIGVLKEYSNTFIQLLDVDYEDIGLCDIVVARRSAIVRHLGEEPVEVSLKGLVMGKRV